MSYSPSTPDLHKRCSDFVENVMVFMLTHSFPRILETMPEFKTLDEYKRYFTRLLLNECKGDIMKGFKRDFDRNALNGSRFADFCKEIATDVFGVEDEWIFSTTELTLKYWLSQSLIT